MRRFLKLFDDFPKFLRISRVHFGEIVFLGSAQLCNKSVSSRFELGVVTYAFAIFIDSIPSSHGLFQVLIHPGKVFTREKASLLNALVHDRHKFFLPF